MQKQVNWRPTKARSCATCLWSFLTCLEENYTRENTFWWKMLSQLDCETKGQVHSKNQTAMPQGAINMPSTKKMCRDPPSYWCPTDLSNNLWIIHIQSKKEVNKFQNDQVNFHHSSKVYGKQNQNSTYNSGVSWPSSQNKKFQYIYAKVGKLKVNNKVMCHLSMKFSDMSN